jgi:hypothetical protein
MEMLFSSNARKTELHSFSKAPMLSSKIHSKPRGGSKHSGAPSFRRLCPRQANANNEPTPEFKDAGQPRGKSDNRSFADVHTCDDTFVHGTTAAYAYVVLARSRTCTLLKAQCKLELSLDF